VAFDPEDPDEPPAKKGKLLKHPGQTLLEPRMWEWIDLLAADLPKPDTFWGPVIARQQLALLAARKGSGKTYLALALGAAVALGRPFGHLPVRQGKVLFLSQELPEPVIQLRGELLFTTPDLKALQGKFRLSCKRPIKLDPAGLAYLRSIVEAEQADLVIIDALGDILPSGTDENSNKDMGSFLRALRDQVAVPTNCAILLIHHMGKPGQDGSERGGRGASVIEDVCADIVYLRQSSPTSRTGTFAKIRSGYLEQPEFTLNITEDSSSPQPRVYVEIGSGTPEVDQEARDIRKLVEWISSTGPHTYPEIEQHLHLQRRAAERLIAQARTLNLLQKSPGSGKGKRPATFEPTSTNPTLKEAE
jgi:hypothetical protein